MDNELKYYTVFSKDDQAYPMLRVNSRDCDKNGTITLMHLEFNSPIPRKPVMADFLEGSKVFVSKRIAKAMQEMNMEGVQFVQTKITMPKGEIIEDYVCVLVDNNTYRALDEEKSKFTKDEDDDDLDMVFYETTINIFYYFYSGTGYGYG